MKRLILNNLVLAAVNTFNELKDGLTLADFDYSVAFYKDSIVGNNFILEEGKLTHFIKIKGISPLPNWKDLLFRNECFFLLQIETFTLNSLTNTVSISSRSKFTTNGITFDFYNLNTNLIVGNIVTDRLWEYRVETELVPFVRESLLQ